MSSLVSYSPTATAGKVALPRFSVRPSVSRLYCLLAHPLYAKRRRKWAGESGLIKCCSSFIYLFVCLFIYLFIYPFFTIFRQTSYLNIYRTDLYPVCRDGTTMAADERSEVTFSIPQETLLWLLKCMTVCGWVYHLGIGTGIGQTYFTFELIAA